MTQTKDTLFNEPSCSMKVQAYKSLQQFGHSQDSTPDLLTRRRPTDHPGLPDDVGWQNIAISFINARPARSATRTVRMNFRLNSNPERAPIPVYRDR